MSADFLSRLVDRAKGTAETARPILAPLFAPGPMTLATGAAREDAEHEADPDALAASPPIRAAGVGSRAGDASPEPRVAREAASVAIAGAVLPQAADATGSGIPERAQGASLAPTSARSRAPYPARGEPPDARRSQRAELAEPTSRLRPRELEGPPRSDRARRRRLEVPSSSAPIVRISIGRVEVRAIPSPEPVAPRAAPACTTARLSLEEYLRPRSRRR